jgi:hypothetical protein
LTEGEVDGSRGLTAGEIKEEEIDVGEAHIEDTVLRGREAIEGEFRNS